MKYSQEGSLKKFIPKYAPFKVKAHEAKTDTVMDMPSSRS